MKINIDKKKLNQLKKKFNWTNVFLTLIAIVLIVSICNNINNNNDIANKNKNSNNNKDIVIQEKKNISNDEYIYKEDLLSLNYKIDEIKIIESKLSEIDVQKYLLDQKYDNLISFISSNYFNAKNIKRYQNFFNNNDYSESEVVLYVELGLDNDFYTNMNKSKTSDGKLILVNKYNYIDKDYDGNLVDVEDNYGKGKMNNEAYKYFKKMVDAAKKDDISLKGISIYRSYDTQKSIYESYVKKDGQEKADTYSARPGHSEHQTGLGVDINTASSNAHFEDTKEYNWLINNSYKYGFILRYPKDKTFITGYKYEPWHYRYIGVKDAIKLYEEQITFEEYYFKYVQ